MKLFIWDNAYEVSYGGAMVFAVAENVEAAREQLRTTKEAPYGLGDSSEKDTTFLGEPSRIIDYPHAEYWEWQQ